MAVGVKNTGSRLSVKKIIKEKAQVLERMLSNSNGILVSSEPHQRYSNPRKIVQIAICL